MVRGGPGNLPPGAANDPNAPWNQPDPEDYLPLVCDECGFYAETLQELDDHEHGEESFVPPAPDPDPEEYAEPPPEAFEEKPGPPMVPPEEVRDEDVDDSTDE